MIDPATRGAWRELEAKLRPFIARRLRSEVDVDDVLQDVFLRMQRGLAELRDEERFGPWVYQIARRAIVDHQRVAAKHRVVEGADLEEQTARQRAWTELASVHAHAVGARGPSEAKVRCRRQRTAPALGAGQHRAFEEDEDDRAVERELARYLTPFVATLRAPYREALTLVELEGLTQKQAAEALGISLSGMKSRVQRGRALLRRALEDCCHITLDARRRVVSCEPRPDGRLPDGCCA